MKEAYCSYEVSKLLKEKGFNVPTEMVWYEHIPSYNVAHKRETGSKKLDYFYWDENTERNSFYTNDTNDNGMPAYIIGEVYSAPTHQMACAWLRKKHNVCITIYPDKENGYEAVLYDIEDDVEIVLQSFGIYGIHIYEETYEEAVEAALKYSLENLI